MPLSQKAKSRLYFTCVFVTCIAIIPSWRIQLREGVGATFITLWMIKAFILFAIFRFVKQKWLVPLLGILVVFGESLPYFIMTLPYLFRGGETSMVPALMLMVAIPSLKLLVPMSLIHGFGANKVWGAGAMALLGGWMIYTQTHSAELEFLDKRAAYDAIRTELREYGAQGKNDPVFLKDVFRRCADLDKKAYNSYGTNCARWIAWLSQDRTYCNYVAEESKKLHKTTSLQSFGNTPSPKLSPKFEEFMTRDGCDIAATVKAPAAQKYALCQEFDALPWETCGDQNTNCGNFRKNIVDGCLLSFVKEDGSKLCNAAPSPEWMKRCLEHVTRIKDDATRGIFNRPIDALAYDFAS